MLKSKVQIKGRIIAEFVALKQLLGSVPTRMEFCEAMETDFYKSVKADRKNNPFGNYLEFLEMMATMGHFQDTELDEIGEEGKTFIHFIETTSMSQLYKIPVLLAFCRNGQFHISVSSREIVESIKAFYKNPQNGKDLLRNKNGMDYRDWSDERYEKLAYDNPVKFLCKTHGDIFELDQMTKDLRIVLDLRRNVESDGFMREVMDAISFKRSDFLNTRLANWEEDCDG